MSVDAFKARGVPRSVQAREEQFDGPAIRVRQLDEPRVQRHHEAVRDEHV